MIGLTLLRLKSNSKTKTIWNRSSSQREFHSSDIHSPPTDHPTTLQGPFASEFDSWRRKTEIIRNVLFHLVIDNAPGPPGPVHRNQTPESISWRAVSGDWKSMIYSNNRSSVRCSASKATSFSRSHPAGLAGRKWQVVYLWWIKRYFSSMRNNGYLFGVLLKNARNGFHAKGWQTISYVIFMFNDDNI